MLQITYQTRALEYSQTREQWLERAAALMRGSLIPQLGGRPYRISCGWPSQAAMARTKRRIGECWYPEHCTDHTNHNIFISPALQDTSLVLQTLAHELIHVATGPNIGHKGQFVKIAKAIGFTKPWTSTPATPALIERLNAFISKLGSYPHAAIDRSGRKKQSTRLLKVICPACGYTVRVTQQWIETGLPTCPCGAQMEQAQ
jgi:hypothetical protein